MHYALCAMHFTLQTMHFHGTIHIRCTIQYFTYTMHYSANIYYSLCTMHFPHCTIHIMLCAIFFCAMIADYTLWTTHVHFVLVVALFSRKIGRPEIGTWLAEKIVLEYSQKIGATRPHRSSSPSPRGDWWTSTSTMKEGLPFRGVNAHAAFAQGTSSSNPLVVQLYL